MEKAGDDSLEMQTRSLCWNISPCLCRADPSPHFQSWVCSGCRSHSRARPIPAWTECSGRTDGRTGGGTGSMLSLATCCLFHSKPPFLPTLQPEFSSPHSSPSPVDGAGIRSHLPNAFLMLSLILHRQHLREQNQIFSSALSCAFYRKGSGMPFPGWVRGEGPCHGRAGGSPGEA